MASLFGKRFLSLVLICLVKGSNAEVVDDSITLREAEIEIVQEKLKLYREKLELLKALKAE